MPSSVYAGQLQVKLELVTTSSTWLQHAIQQQLRGFIYVMLIAVHDCAIFSSAEPIFSLPECQLSPPPLSSCMDVHVPRPF